MIGALLIVAAVLPPERMEEANRLFSCGQYEQAAKAYRELSGQEGIAADEILFHLAELDSDRVDLETRTAALSLGKLESRAGEFDHADLSLKKAVELNDANDKARAEAYIMLARNAGAKGDWRSAAYATVVMSLFDDAELCAEAQRIISEPPEAR